MTDKLELTELMYSMDNLYKGDTNFIEVFHVKRVSLVGERVVVHSSALKYILYDAEDVIEIFQSNNVPAFEKKLQEVIQEYKLLEREIY